MIVGATSQRPEELAFCRLDREIVDAGEATLHEALFVELPVFVAVGAKPLPGIVVPFIGKMHRDAFAGTGPQLLDQSVVEFPGPFAANGQVFSNSGMSLKEGRSEWFWDMG